MQSVPLGSGPPAGSSPSFIPTSARRVPVARPVVCYPEVQPSPSGSSAGSSPSHALRRLHVTECVSSQPAKNLAASADHLKWSSMQAPLCFYSLERIFNTGSRPWVVV
ncbi:uncharacterized [Tachysurus ichikawai]